MIGTRIGPYEIVGWLGAGGMGQVYRARDARLGRDVAIKLIAESFAGDANRVHRFEQEARAAGQLNHPNILAVHDAGIHDGAPYIVSELLEGESLRTRLQAGVLPPRKAIEYARQTAEGLAAAHDKGIVHRDVKPDNLFITSDGRIKILDFGIAKLTTQDADGGGRTGVPTDTAAGTVVGTAGYMSPEQVRGEVVDARSDIFSVGTVLYEMLTGRAPFSRETAADSMAAILKEDPPEPRSPDIPPALARIISRCLEKTREARFQSARDLAFGLDVLSGTHATAAPGSALPPPRRWRTALGAAIVVLSLAAAVASWWRGLQPASFEQRLARAKFTTLTNFEGSELDAAISPDGKFVAFLSDRDGPFHAWLMQVSTGSLRNVTPGKEDQRNAGPIRSVGFSPEAAEVWINGSANRRMTLVPLMGGPSRFFLAEHALNVTWSPDGTRLVYLTYDAGDALFVADSTGGNARRIFIGENGLGDHNHFMVWSPDAEWIYFTRSSQSVAEFDVWRIPSSGGTPERLTDLHTDIRYLTVIDAGTLLFVAPEKDRSGPWLWALDVERKVARRVSVGLDTYLSVAASADGRRLVATVAKPIADLWTVPILDRLADESDVTPQPLPTVRGSAPRFGKGSLFYLSSSGGGDGLFRLQDGKAVEIWKGSDEALLEPASISPRADRVAVVLSKQGKRRLTLLSADGADHQSLAEGIDVRGTSAWSPDGTWIVTGGNDATGPGLFRIPLDHSAPIRLATGPAFDPVVSPDGNLIVYAGPQTAAAPLLAVRPDGSAVTLPRIRVPSGGGGRSRFLPDGNLVYMSGPVGTQDFWLLNLTTNKTRQLTRLSNPATMSSFDVAPDGSHIVFDRVRERSDIVLIDLPK
jgi:serine/threonine protein kinase/Tol biopolymer transport system component